MIFNAVPLLCSLVSTSSQGFCDAADANAVCSNCAYDETSVGREEDKERAIVTFSLLQANLAELKQRVPQKRSPPPNFQSALPLAWTHVPKCGGSFIHSLVRLPGVCPDWPVGSFFNCPGFSMASFSYCGAEGYSSHQFVGSLFEEVYAGHGLIMLRQPEQRSISHYNHLTITEGIQLNMDKAEFAKRTKGCVVRMLTKEHPPHCRKHTGFNACLGFDTQFKHVPALEVTNADVVEARRRLHGYVFVGITEEWPLSICLLHAMLGGACDAKEFANGRPGAARNSSELYDTSELRGVIDEYDGALYDEALSMFALNRERHGVTWHSCQPCFQSAGLTVASNASP